jgi:hypothetical protein
VRLHFGIVHGGEHPNQGRLRVCRAASSQFFSKILKKDPI